jgi:hypothetical protein
MWLVQRSDHFTLGKQLPLSTGQEAGLAVGVTVKNKIHKIINTSGM